jgi:hypothetical protein
MKSQKAQPYVFARSPVLPGTTKQSHEIKHSENKRLLRFARNDHFGELFVRPSGLGLAKNSQDF